MVEADSNVAGGVVVGQRAHDAAHVALAHGMIHVLEVVRQRSVEQRPARCRRHVTAIAIAELRDAPFDALMQLELVEIERALDLVQVPEDGYVSVGIGGVAVRGARLGEVIAADQHVQIGHGHRTAVCWAQDVVGRQHQHPCFCLGL